MTSTPHPPPDPQRPAPQPPTARSPEAPEPGPRAPARQEPDPHRWRALGVCLAIGFITMLDVSIVNVALPSIERSLDAGASQLQLIVAGYTLAFGLVLVPAGRLGDARGRRTLFLVGLTGFALTSLGAGLAPSDEVLAAMRLLQGASAGLLNPQVVGTIQQLFSGYERGRAFGYFGATIGVSTALGPLLGGLIIQAFGAEHGWRWVFFVNVPVIAVVLPLAVRFLPRGRPGPSAASARSGRPRLDVPGLALVAVTTTAVMVPFVITTGEGGDDPARWWWLAVAAVLAVATVAWERGYQRRTGAAVLDPRVLGEPSFRNGALLGMAYFAGFTAVFLVTTLYLQQIAGFTPLQAGLVGMPFAIASAVAAQQSGRLVATRGRALVVVGLVLVLTGLVGTDLAIRLVDPPAVGLVVAGTQMVAGAGSGLVISPNQTLTLARVPLDRAGVAGSMLQVGQRVGSALGVAVALSTYYTALAAGVEGGVAAGRALLVTVALVAVALVVGVVDLVARRRDPAATGGTSGPGAVVAGGRAPARAAE
ncbi:MFS transporter [Cellulomonas sp. ES6]|uniref:MFS transporter n=1 Tax=Cellulomonas sp. ES6 TaxID=3039384 RepID=UPI0024B73F15|nr:MFS transporter [Cellulomonas sp. ES6]WHP18392.1 MFS transporter [Cellulomonas sp. ES6]